MLRHFVSIEDTEAVKTCRILILRCIFPLFPYFNFSEIGIILHFWCFTIITGSVFFLLVLYKIMAHLKTKGDLYLMA